VCRGGDEVSQFLLGGCHDGDWPAGTFFATQQSGPGCRACALPWFTTTAGCTNLSCGTTCQRAPALTNDLFGCGSLGTELDPASCAGLARTSNDGCSDLGAPWSCPPGGEESLRVVKPGAAGGGVLCCLG
jgi:hypothetical protein